MVGGTYNDEIVWPKDFDPKLAGAIKLKSAQKWSFEMSVLILEFAKSFVRGRISPEIFSEAYIELWRIERDNGTAQLDSDELSACLSTIFCLADLYSQYETRESYELDGAQLLNEVSRLVGLQ